MKKWKGKKANLEFLLEPKPDVLGGWLGYQGKTRDLFVDFKYLGYFIYKNKKHCKEGAILSLMITN